MHWIANHSNAKGNRPEHWRLRTFVVDDVPQIVSTLTRFLQSQPGFEVVGSASCAVEALARCFVVNPNLVIVDEGLPDFSGSQCAKLILQRHPQALVVLMSGDDSSEEQTRSGYSGVLGFVAKTRLHQDLFPEIFRLVSHSP